MIGVGISCVRWKAYAAASTRSLFKIAVIASVGRMTDKDAQELRQLEERLKDVVLMAEGFIPRPPTGVFDAGTEPAGELAIRLFDAHLAAESAIVLSSQSVPPFALVHAIIEGDPIPGTPVTPDELQAETSQALIRLGEARALLARTIEKGYRTDLPRSLPWQKRMAPRPRSISRSANPSDPFGAAGQR